MENVLSEEFETVEEAVLGRRGPAPIGTDGKPMTSWQIWLRRLCVVMIVWAVFELLIGAGLLATLGLLPAEALAGIEQFAGLNAQDAWTLLGVSALAGAVVNLVMAMLGIRGSKNPRKIAFFFWIALIDAVLTSWALASSISQGIFDVPNIVSGLFIISVAVCAWQVRGQTGYFDNHP